MLDSISKVSRTDLAVIVGVCCLSVVISLVGIDNKSLSFGETQALQWASYPLSEITQTAAKHDHAPTHYMMAHLWMGVVGDSGLSLRLFSVLWTVLTVPLIYLSGRLVTGHWLAGMAGALLFITVPHTYRYTQETRLYTFANFATMLGIFALVLGSLHYRNHLPVWLGSGIRSLIRGQSNRVPLLSDLGWLTLGLSILVVVTTHHAIAIYSVALGLTFLIMLGFVRRRYWTVLIVNFSIMAVVIMVVYAFWIVPGLLVAINHYAEHTGSGRDPIPLLGLVRWAYRGGLDWYALCITAPLAVLGVWSCWRKGIIRDCLPLFLIGILGIILVYLVGSVIFPSLTVHSHRVVLWVLPPFLALVGIGCAALWYYHHWGKVAAPVLFSAVIGLHAYGLVQVYHKETPHHMDEVVSTIEQNVQPGDAILVNPPWIYHWFYYYWNRSQLEFDPPVYIATCRDDHKQARETISCDDPQWYRRADNGGSRTVGHKPASLLNEYGRIWITHDKRACFNGYSPTKVRDGWSSLLLIEAEGN